MLRKKAFHFRSFPNQEQAVLISKTLKCRRSVFNRFLACWNETYKQTGKGLDSTVLQSSLQTLADAFTRFFKKQNEAPRFKSEKNKVQTYHSCRKTFEGLYIQSVADGI
ncbi:helix-turn-helix domain-containing protein [Brevibacillus antibioticus]|uniref:helix-turn-helix domain-containing protein n=1 Tax=Brevibacillus antibioticus TaxID=2570228 RepID=UPI002697C40F